MRFETFAPLAGYPHAFTLRDPSDDTRAAGFPAQLAEALGYPSGDEVRISPRGVTRPTISTKKVATFVGRVTDAASFLTDGYSGQFAAAEQPHGNGVAVVDQPGTVGGVDALITRRAGLPLIIRCADCVPVFIFDRAAPAIALIHSGKKGTLANVVGATVAALRPSAGVAFIGPSIGPCHYEVDLWTAIEAQLRAAGITEIHNPRVCTACHLDRYYSYRAERGQTGRMFALLALAGGRASRRAERETLTGTSSVSFQLAHSYSGQAGS